MQTAERPTIAMFSGREDGKSGRFRGWTFRVSAGEVLAIGAVSGGSARVALSHGHCKRLAVEHVAGGLPRPLHDCLQIVDSQTRDPAVLDYGHPVRNGPFCPLCRSPARRGRIEARRLALRGGADKTLSPSRVRMITYAQALELVNRELGQYLRTGDDEVVVVEPRTIERDFGWVFSYESRKALETNDIRYALSGNGPIIVDRYDGSLHRFGSLCSRRDAFDAYEAELAKRIDRETLGSILKEIARSLETNGHSNKAEFVAALVTILKWDHLASIPGLKSDVMWGGGTSISGVSEFNSPEDRESFVRLLLRLADLMRRFGIASRSMESAAQAMSSWLESPSIH